jgi:hypothetical protein
LPHQEFQLAAVERDERFAPFHDRAEVDFDGVDAAGKFGADDGFFVG